MGNVVQRSGEVADGMASVLASHVGAGCCARVSAAADGRVGAGFGASARLTRRPDEP